MHYGKHHDIINWGNIFLHLELPELVFCSEREEKVEVMFTNPLKSVAGIPVAAGFYSRAYYALTQSKKTPILLSLLHLNMSQKKSSY